jgi:hypothetical protein
MPLSFTLTTAAACLALMLVGGGLYEFLVVDPSWPKRLDLVQPERGGISRRRFWIPIHTLFELCVISALVAAPTPLCASGQPSTSFPRPSHSNGRTPVPSRS